MLKMCICNLVYRNCKLFFCCWWNLDRCVSTTHAHQHSCSGIDFVKSLNQLQHVSVYCI